VQRLRNTYGSGPLLLRTPPRLPRALILSPDHVQRVLAGSPEPFAVASSEKSETASHFQPKGLLISHGAERAHRRRFNEEVLDTNRPVHRLGEHFVPIVREESERLLDDVRRRGDLVWDDFARTWFRIVRRVVLGDGARDDQTLTDELAQLRSGANWAFLRPKRRRLQQRFFDRLNGHLARAEPGSLAGVMATTPTSRDTVPLQQVPQWLFAFDAAGMATFRALALLAAHPEYLRRAHAELRDQERMVRQDLPFLRACVLESVRLWPTTPLVLRQSVAETTWETGVMPVQTGIILFAPFFHRDDQRLPYANRFSPELWLEDRAEQWPLIPFSGGPAQCPGENLVLLLSSTTLAWLLEERRIRLEPPARLDARRPLPGTLNNFGLRFTLDG
jgi:cytochrome P450